MTNNKPRNARLAANLDSAIRAQEHMIAQLGPKATARDKGKLLTLKNQRKYA